jgi:hypothetical protein
METKNRRAIMGLPKKGLGKRDGAMICCCHSSYEKIQGFGINLNVA